MEAKKILEQQFDQMVEVLQQTLRFNTEKAAPTPDAPFGQNVAHCLQFVLDTCKQFGFETYNCDNFAGHADFAGSGDEVLGILGHLDVVPAKAEEWDHAPYGAEICDGKIFARGAMDDKGPMIACLFAMKALKESGFVPKKTVRLIFGCDEESGMQCVKHYFSKVPYPTVAFSPDADFPVINIEKGICHLNLVCGKLPDGVAIEAGDRANVVPSLCKATVPACVQAEGVSAASQGNTTLLQTSGKSAHASTPDEGENAAHAMLKVLHKMYPENAALDFLCNKICDTTGGKWGIALCDSQSGALTCNLGVLRTAPDGTVTATIDIRFPATISCQQMEELLHKCTPANVKIEGLSCSAPLLVPQDSVLVSTLMDVFNKACNTNLKPLAIGGGTYSRCLPNCVAFGPLFPGEEQTIHMPNECIILDNLKLMAEIYLEAIARLAA